MEYAPLTTSGFEGYLAELNYFPGWEGGETGYDMPDGETPVPATVESYYEDTTIPIMIQRQEQIVM